MGKWTLLCPTDCAPLQGECYYTGGHGKPFVLVCKKGLKSISFKEAHKALQTHKAEDNPGHSTECEKKRERCIKKLKGTHGINPYAVCRAAVKCPPK